jgi:acetoin:2,6-dichlorophenolindophenol oxidoreductase subunit alpha
MTIKLHPDQRRRIFEKMVLMRHFEESCLRLSASGDLAGHFHLYIGQEATGASVLDVLDPKDLVLTTHRNHGHMIGRGVDPERALAELMGRAEGLNGGRGGTLHLTDRSRNFLQTSAVVGGALSLAGGAAYGLKRSTPGRLAAAFFGDGALEEGVTYETQNLAALWSLPLLMVCENNATGALATKLGGYPGAMTATKEYTAIPKSYGIRTWVVDGNSVNDVFAAATEATAHIRAGKGPAFIEAITERWAGSKPIWPTNATGYTDIRMATGDASMEGEHKEWYSHFDPVLKEAREMLEDGVITADEIKSLFAEIGTRMAEAAQRAVAMPMPTPETAFQRVYA